MKLLPLILTGLAAVSFGVLAQSPKADSDTTVKSNKDAATAPGTQVPPRSPAKDDAKPDASAGASADTKADKPRKAKKVKKTSKVKKSKEPKASAGSSVGDNTIPGGR